MPRGDKLRRIILAFVTSVLAIGSGVALTHVGRAPEKTAVTADEDTWAAGVDRPRADRLDGQAVAVEPGLQPGPQMLADQAGHSLG